MKSEIIQPAIIGLNGLSSDIARDWQNLDHYRNSKQDREFVEIWMETIKDFIGEPAIDQGQSTSYRPQTIDINRGVLWQFVDDQLSISEKHSEPVRILTSGGRTFFVFETDEPNIFCEFSLVGNNADEASQKPNTTTITLVKYTPQERELMLAESANRSSRDSRARY